MTFPVVYNMEIVFINNGGTNSIISIYETIVDSTMEVVSSTMAAPLNNFNL